MERNQLDKIIIILLAGKQGFEPRFHDPESCVLPLDDFPASSFKYTIAVGYFKPSSFAVRHRLLSIHFFRIFSYRLFRKSPPPESKWEEATCVLAFYFLFLWHMTEAGGKDRQGGHKRT